MRRLIILYIGMVLGISLLPLDSMAAGFTREAIEFEARSLLNRMEITRDVSYKLKNRLSAALKDPALGQAIDSKGVGAVFTYACGEGGVVVKFMGGDGLITFIGGRKAAPISLKSWSAGAMIGGSAQWGIGLVIGRADENAFGGNYKGGLRAATAWESATTGMLFLRSTNTKETDYHEIYVISISRGLSAGVGGVIMRITPEW